MQSLGTELRERFLGDGDASEERDETPSLYDVVANSINIMQVRVTRSRMAGDPPDLAVTPHLENFALFDFHRADEAIAASDWRSAVRALQSVIDFLLAGAKPSMQIKSALGGLIAGGAVLFLVMGMFLPRTNSKDFPKAERFAYGFIDHIQTL